MPGLVGLPLGLGSSHRVGPILAGRFGVSGNVARPAEYVFCVDALKIVESLFLMGCFGSVVVAGRCLVGGRGPPVGPSVTFPGAVTFSAPRPEVAPEYVVNNFQPPAFPEA